MKTIQLLAILLFIATGSFAQGLPIDKNTNKVTYSGTIELPGMSAGQIADKVLTWFSTETRFRGKFGPVIEIPDDMSIYTTVNIAVTRMIKTFIWTVNAVVIIDYNDGELTYNITDFYTYGSASFIILYVDDVVDSPLEFNRHFNIMNIEQTNDNAKNLDREVTNLIGLMKDYLKG